jgi:hypothetical protein
LKVTDAAGEPINAGDHEHVTAPQKLKDGLKLGAAGGGRATPLLRTDHLAARRAKSCGERNSL